MRFFSTLLLLLALISVLTPVRVLACACCSEPGDYYEHETDFSDFKLDEVGKIGLGSAILHTDAGFPDSIMGIEPIGDNYSVKGSLSGPIWKFEFTDDKSEKAVLSLWRPEKLEEFGVDQSPLETNRMVVLYKELRFRYRVQSATGFLEKGIDAETTFNLVLQGRGNGCMNASDFSTYILQVKGNKADYSFYGKLNIAKEKIERNQIGNSLEKTDIH